LKFINSSTLPNWQIAFNDNIAGTLEFAPSTAPGGSTFTTPVMVINDGGNVGIGTNAPTDKLEVNGTVKALSFSGSGGGLTSLDANNLSSGTVTEARIDAAIARDSEILPTVLASDGTGSGLDADLLDGLDSTAFAPASGSTVYVAKAGDTMTGALNLPANGLAIGTDQLVLSGGNVGIGTTNPSSKLDIAGTMRTISTPEVSPTTGKGIEILYQSAPDRGRIFAYDRDGSADPKMG
jgi:hypothetical protein